MTLAFLFFVDPITYSLNDKVTEKHYKFNLETSLLKSKSNPLLQDWTFLLKYEDSPEEELTFNNIKGIYIKNINNHQKSFFIISNICLFDAKKLLLNVPAVSCGKVSTTSCQKIAKYLPNFVLSTKTKRDTYRTQKMPMRRSLRFI